MRAFAIVLAASAALIGRALAAPVQIVNPGDTGDIVITDKDTTNATQVANSTSTPKEFMSTQSSTVPVNQLPLSFINNFGGAAINAYVTGLDTNNNIVLLQPDGTWFTPPSTSATTPQAIVGNIAIPIGGQGSKLNINLPDYISAARIWFAAGELNFYVVNGADGKPSLVEPSSANPNDPSAGVNWGFVELTWTPNGGLYANISYVDFVGLILGMSMVAGDGTTQSAQGLQADAVASICRDLAAQASSDGQPWDQLCLADSSGTPLRVIAPNDYISTNPNAWNDYYTEHINAVWTQYASQPLTIDTQAAAGKVACTVSSSNGLLTCEGDNRGYAQPTVADIWGCNSGPFAIEAGDNAVHQAVVPRLCAAFIRTTLLLEGGDVQPALPSTSYYSVGPTNWYSQAVHKYEVNNIGYAFSYDDVNPEGENQSGVVADADPQLLTITIGGPSAS